MNNNKEPEYKFVEIPNWFYNNEQVKVKLRESETILWSAKTIENSGKHNLIILDAFEEIPRFYKITPK